MNIEVLRAYKELLCTGVLIYIGKRSLPRRYDNVSQFSVATNLDWQKVWLMFEKFPLQLQKWVLASLLCRIRLSAIGFSTCFPVRTAVVDPHSLLWLLKFPSRKKGKEFVGLIVVTPFYLLAGLGVSGYCITVFSLECT